MAIGADWEVVHNSGQNADLESKQGKITIYRSKSMPAATFISYFVPGTHVDDVSLKMLIKNYQLTCEKCV